ncbi:protein of unknown function [Pseudomonas sp. JV551A1]|nr:protein of unknown function [Pseudomonas sp. JV551A1]
MVGVTQQGNAVGAGHACTCPLHYLLHDPAAQALAIFGLGRGIGFGHQDVAVGQQVKPARVVQSASERFHLSAWCCLGLVVLWPAHCRGDIHGGEGSLDWIGQLGGWATAVEYIQQGGFAAGSQAGGQ